MCGIAGYWSFKDAGEADRLNALAREMTKALAHRGPDDSGIWIETKAGLALGHRRLSILDLSSYGHQPMASASGRFVIVYNGEIYNFKTLRKDLEAKGRQFLGHSDTEIMLAAIEEWGLRAALHKFEGMFAFALWDRQAHTLTLARDRLGQKPLYYGRQTGQLFFGSEVRAIRAHKDFKPEIDRAALDYMLRFAHVPPQSSIYKDIRQVPPGHFLVLQTKADQKAEPEAYWNFADLLSKQKSSTAYGPQKEIMDKARSLITNAVTCRMIADVPLGSFLSGGIDSSLVTAVMQHNASRPVRTFSIGFENSDYNEAGYAKEIAEYLGTDHTEFYVDAATARDVVPDLPEIYDEPFADPSQIPTYLLCKLARNEVTVALTGDGGDESFGGYERYRIYNSLAPFISSAPVRRIMGKIIKVLPVPVSKQRLQQALNLALQGQSPAEIYRRLLSMWQDTPDLVEGQSFSYKPAEVWNAELQDFRQVMMADDTRSYLPGAILTKLDRASMAVSLEARSPLLDHTLIEWAWTLPVSNHFKGKTGKYILRSLLGDYVPLELFNRPKKGFGVPQGAWLRGPMRGWAEDLFTYTELEAQGINAEAVHRYWQQHLSGERDRSYDLWPVLMFQAWARKWM